MTGPRSWYLYPRTQLRTERTPLILPNTREASLVAAGVHQAPLVASEEVETLSRVTCHVSPPVIRDTAGGAGARQPGRRDDLPQSAALCK